MSPWVMDAVGRAGAAAFPDAARPRQMMMGMEILHLIGNSIFLASLGCLYYCIRSRWNRWALYVEGFHLYEHLMLTATAYFLGKPVGLSTLFGGQCHDREPGIRRRLSGKLAFCDEPAADAIRHDRPDAVCAREGGVMALLGRPTAGRC